MTDAYTALARCYDRLTADVDYAAWADYVERHFQKWKRPVRAVAELGCGTGKLKLRQVYDLFVTRFPWLAKTVSFELFSSLVDDALDEMRDMLDKNEAVKAFVNREDM